MKKKALWLKARELAQGGAPLSAPGRVIKRRLRPISARRRGALQEYRVAATAFLQEHARCEKPRCRRPSEDVHHSRGRAGTLLLDRRFWKAVCRRCHNWIQMHPVEARELGLLCEPGRWNSPPRDDERA